MIDFDTYQIIFKSGESVRIGKTLTIKIRLEMFGVFVLFCKLILVSIRTLKTENIKTLFISSFLYKKDLVYLIDASCNVSNVSTHSGGLPRAHYRQI